MKKTKLPFTNWDFYRKQETAAAEDEGKLNGQRQAYMQALDQMLDATMKAHTTPESAQMPVQDLALVAVFLASVKMVELSGNNADQKSVLGAANFLLHRVTEEFPEMAKHLGEETNAG